MSWRHSLIRIATFEVEQLQKRLKEVEERRAAMELALDALAVAWCHPDYVKRWKQRRAQAEAQLNAIVIEAEGARDALSLAFEEQKKVEHAESLAKASAAKETLKREGAVLDDIALQSSFRKSGLVPGGA